MKKKLLIVGGIVLLILFLDQLLKIYTKNNFTYGESCPLLGEWFVMEYIENPGMAFGTTFGSKYWHKLALSLFRVFAICGISYYCFDQARKGMKLEFLIAVGLVLAGATGNLIDSAFYDFLYEFDPCAPVNRMEGSGLYAKCYGINWEHRNSGFLMGNVVDMFRFQATWPSWMPMISGKEIFPAIWNIADASITCGVAMIFIRQKAYFKK